MPPSAFLQSVQVQITNTGFAILRSVLPRAEMDIIRDAARAFYEVAERPDPPPFPRAYLYNPGNTATGMAALDDYGTKDYQLLRTVANSPATECLRHYLGDDVLCSLTHSRLRKNYPQGDLSRPRPSTVAWHADGGANVNYYSAYILWVPFTPCDDDHTGLELQALDGTTSRPELAIGDALLFSDKLLHRTADCPTATQARFSCDMRFFRAADIPVRVHQKVSQEPLLSVRAFASPPW